MTVYLLVLSFTCVLALGSVFLPRRWRILRDVFSLVGYGTMCLFVGLRDHVGADWDNYIGVFDLVTQRLSPLTYILVEPLYAICNTLAYSVGGDIHLVNLICAIIFLASLFRFSRLVNMDSNLLLFIAAPYLLFVVGMSYTRQAVALGLALNAIGHLRHGRTGKFYLFVFLATLFHYSAIVLALLWWLNSSKRTTAFLIALAVAIPTMFILFSGSRYVALYLKQNNAIQSHGVGFRILIVVVGLFVILSQKLKWARETETGR